MIASNCHCLLRCWGVLLGNIASTAMAGLQARIASAGVYTSAPSGGEAQAESASAAAASGGDAKVAGEYSPAASPAHEVQLLSHGLCRF